MNKKQEMNIDHELASGILFRTVVLIVMSNLLLNSSGPNIEQQHTYWMVLCKHKMKGSLRRAPKEVAQGFVSISRKR